MYSNTGLKSNFYRLYFSISILCSFILLLRVSGRNIERFTSPHSPDCLRLTFCVVQMLQKSPSHRDICVYYWVLKVFVFSKNVEENCHWNEINSTSLWSEVTFFSMLKQRSLVRSKWVVFISSLMNLTLLSWEQNLLFHPSKVTKSHFISGWVEETKGTN